jgi:hypothetical protein
VSLPPGHLDRRADALDTARNVALDLEVPQPDHLPPTGGEFGVHSPVAVRVDDDLPVPEGP